MKEKIIDEKKSRIPLGVWESEEEKNKSKLQSVIKPFVLSCTNAKIFPIIYNS